MVMNHDREEGQALGIGGDAKISYACEGWTAVTLSA
jgi:hypothetical protein